MTTKEEILKALSYVDDPDLKKDLVTLNMIENIEINGQKVSFDVILTTPACPLKESIQQACIRAVQHFCKNVEEVTPNMKSRVSKTSSLKGGIKGVKQIIGVASGKGGVGKSTVSAALALSLNELGATVGLLDADVHGPSLPTMFQLEGAQPKITKERKVHPIKKYGIQLMSIGFLVNPDQPIIWRGPAASAAVKQFITEVLWEDIDYLIVDLPPGTGDILITVAQQFPINGIVMVTTPQKMSQTDCKKAISMFQHQSINVNILGIVENMSWFSPAELDNKKYHIFGEGGADILSKEFDLEILAKLPIEPELMKFIDQGKSISLLPNNIKMPYLKLAQSVVQQIAIKDFNYQSSKA